MLQRYIFIEAVSPTVDAGRYPVKKVVGETLCVEADILRDGHDCLRAELLWSGQGGEQALTLALTHYGNDRWGSFLELTAPGRFMFQIAAWTDHFATWKQDLEKRVLSGMPVSCEVTEGMHLLQRTARAAWGAAGDQLAYYAARLGRSGALGSQALAIAQEPLLSQLMAQWQARADKVVSPAYDVVVEVRAALFGSWYEMFPRSQGEVPGVASSLRQAARRFPDIARMGFDVLYLPPIHPIGKTNRKGRNNALHSTAGDPGSPWAIGNEHGGHMAVDPALGTLEDFDFFVAEAQKFGLAIALDFAVQCSPDHPWVKEHPTWFYQRADGSIKYAENPPKRYQDVYPLNFSSPDALALWHALLEVVLFWVGRGVKIFRVDNPHTKPLAFWRWLIERVQAQYPDVIFLAEAFTRPKMMQALGKIGFSQSYTYFTWRNHKRDLIDYVHELAYSGMQLYYRPNFFANTPDILPDILQRGGSAAFRMRLVLAGTLSPSYGIYSGFELCENQGIAGREEYLDSEKYEIKVRNWEAPGHIKDLVACLNRIRRENVALQNFCNVRFFHTDNEHILSYGKRWGDNTLIVTVNLDPWHTQESTVHVDTDFLSGVAGPNFPVTDLLSGAKFAWSQANFVRLDPQAEPAHILRVEAVAC